MTLQSEPRNPYLDDTGHPQLRRSVAAYVDILGYRDMTQRAIESGQGQQFLRELRETFSRSFSSLRITSQLWARLPAPWTTKTFSDNIVVGYPIPHKDGELELSVVLGRSASFQLEMTLGGLFIRGAVAVGDLYLDEQIVFGPALLEAYKAEQRLARDPRIVLTPSTVSAVRAQLKRYPDMKKAWHDDAVLRDADGQYFVNYLDEVVAYEHDMGYPDIAAMARHRDVVTRQLTDFASDPPRLVKYLWAARYHNFFCEERPDFSDQIKVDISAVQVRPARLSSCSGDEDDV